MSDMNEQGSEVQNNPDNTECSQEEYSKSILIEVGHKEISNKLFKAYLDNKKYIYYAPTFSIFTNAADKFALTWNLFAFFIPSLWLLYRKMYLYGVIALILSIVLTFAGPLFSEMNAVNSTGTVSNEGIIIDVILGLIVNVIIGLIGNYLYFIHTKSKLLKIMHTVPMEEQEAKAKIEGGTNAQIVWIISIVTIASYLLFTYIMLA